MKRRVLFGVLILFLMLSVSLISAQENETEQDKINNAYACLNEKVNDKCQTLLTEEKIFSLLAVKKCKDDLISDSDTNKCWPKTGCSIKTTAQAILALNKAGSGTDAAETWLISTNKTPENLAWYLEIESTEATTCTITYSGGSHSIIIGEDKKISGNAGNCLTLAQDDYLLRISPSCYNVEFQISCDQSFLTTLLFQKSGSSTIHVSETTHSALSQGTTTEKVSSFCFAQGNTCDYEGSLWAAIVLDSLGYDIDSYLPYLITMADDNSRYLPEAFLYILTGSTDYSVDLLTKQQSNKWWEISGDKFYDTAVALYPYQSEDPLEKENAKQWLLEIQDDEGCWEGNLRNTAFLLYSIWPKISAGDDDVDCEDAGYYCRSSGGCDDDQGQIKEAYTGCGGTYICCTVAEPSFSCEEQGGNICSSNQECVGGTTIESEDLNFDEICCVDGECQETGGAIDECADNFGTCRISCQDDEEPDSLYDCPSSGDICCVAKTSEPKNYLWIWILSILILLVIIGIIFRNKIRTSWFKTKSVFGGGRPKGPPSRMPPRIMPERRTLPPRRMMMRRPQQQKSSDFDEVLKKLKEMGS